MLHNSLHRYGVSNDWRFATRMIAFNEPHMVRFVLIVFDSDKRNTDEMHFAMINRGKLGAEI